jgi:mRNA interferase RelE/StbE
LAWTIEFVAGAVADLDALDGSIRRRVVKFLADRVAGPEDPRRFGHALTADLAGFWRYRVGDFRILAQIDDAAGLVLVLRVGHRREVYR